jgi:hypothetical protein
MDVMGSLYVSLGGSRVQLHDKQTDRCSSVVYALSMVAILTTETSL